MNKSLNSILKRILLLVLLAMSGLSGYCADFSYTYDGNTFYFNINSGTATVSLTYGSEKYSGDIIIPNKVVRNGTTYSVTTIGYSAFGECTSLTSVEIPNSVTSIGDYAFGRCTSLTSVEIPNSVTTIGYTAFSQCSSLTSVEIPHSVTSILESTFYGCTSLTSIEIPNSVTTIGPSAFYGCTSLTSVEIPNSVISIGESAFSECSSLSAFCGEIASEDHRCLIKDGVLVAFACNGLTSYKIPNSVTTIGSDAFSGCSSLTSVEIPNKVTTIGDYAFCGCSSLTSVEIPNKVTTIGSSAFQDCTSLTSVEIPNSVTTIGSKTFYGCTSLTSVEIPNSVTSIGSFAFRDCTSLTSVEIPNSVTSIGNCAFQNCSSLTSVEIGNSVTTIGSDTFSGCSSLTSVEIPNSVTSIGKLAFSGCSSLRVVEIGKSVTSIGSDAFFGCSSLYGVFNRSKLSISVGGTSNGRVGYYAKAIYNNYENIGDYVFCDVTTSKPKLAGYLGNDKDLILPESCNGKTYEIAPYTFYDMPELKSVRIPAAVTAIGSQAFYGCSGLESLTLYPSVPPTVASDAFVDVPNDLSLFANSSYTTATGWTRFANIIDTQSVTIDNIRYNIFVEGDRIHIFDIVSTDGNEIRRLAIPASMKIDDVDYTVTGVNSNLILPNLESLVIPATITSLEGARIESPKLKKITILANTVPEGISTAFSPVAGRETYVSNGSYDSYSGVLGNINIYSNLSSFFDLDGVEYIPVPATRSAVAFDCDYTSAELTVPSIVYYKGVDLSVTSVRPYAFSGNVGMTTFALGGNVPEIGVGAFANCSDLASVTLQDGTTDLSFNASLSGLPVETLYIGREVVYTESPFKNMQNLTHLQALGGARSIKTGEFAGCTALNSIGTAGSMTTIESRAFADNTSISDISLDGEDLSVGDDAFSGCTSLSNITIESGVKKLGSKAFYNTSKLVKMTIQSGLQEIGESAFEGATTLTTMSLPGSVAVLGDRCFYGCRSLQTPLRITNSRLTTLGNYAFYGCSGLPSITIGNGVAAIGDYAFAGCSGANTISIGSKVTSVGSGAFKGCTNISGLTLPQGVSSIGAFAFEDCTKLGSLAVPSLVETIENGVFKNCPVLASVTFSDNVTSIGEEAFMDTPALTSLTLPSRLTAIGSHAFDGSGITSVALPNGVTTVAEGAFARTANLASFDLNKVTEIGPAAFEGSALPSLTIPATLMTIGNGAFNDCYSLAELFIPTSTKRLTLGKNDEGEGLFKDCRLDNLYLDRELTYPEDGLSPFKGNTTLNKVTIGNKIISISESMFADCTNLDEVVLGSALAAMGQGVFAGSGVRSINFPEKLTYIPLRAFQNCPRLTTVDVPRNISRIDSYAFAGSGIRNITLPETLTTIAEYTFQNTANLQSVRIAEGTKTISPNAFAGSGLPSITIPRTVTNIGNAAFIGCNSLSEVIIADGSEQLSLGNNATNQGLFYDAHLVTLYQGRNLKYSTSALYGTSPFYGSATLQNVTIGDLPTKVESKQFYNCTALQNVTIGDAVETIGDYAFSGCSALETFSVGAAVTEIGQEAFSDCTALTEFYTYAIVPPFCGDQALGDIDKFECKLFVPSVSVASYQDAPQWEEFFFTEGFDATIHVSYIELNQYSVSLNPGETVQLTATGYPLTATMGAVTWSSSNPEVATVDNNGLVTSVGAGDAVITATEASGVTATCDIYVRSISISETTLAMCAGDTHQLLVTRQPATDEPLYWNSSNPNVVTVDEDGNVTAVSEGTAVITASDDSGLSVSCSVEVAALKLMLDRVTVDLSAGESIKLISSYNSTTMDAPTVTWTSSDENVATVDATGTVKGIGTGSATITANDGNGHTASCLVNVAAVPFRIYIEDGSVRKGEVNRIPVYMYNEDKINSFNCDIVLPQGVTMAVDDEYGDYLIEPGDRCDASHTIATSEFGGNIRVVCYSSKNRLFKDSGVLFYINVELADNIEDGAELPVRLINCSMTTQTLDDKQAPDTSAILTVAPSVIPGDVNNDGRYNSTDISLVVEYVLGRKPANGKEAAADVNRDGRINSTDISLVVSYILAGKTPGNRAPMRRSNFVCDESIYLDGTTVENGRTRKFTLGLTNADRYTAAQFDIHLPYGMRVADVCSIDGNQQAIFSEIGDGIVRVVLFSPDNSEFVGSRFVDIFVENYFGSDAEFTITDALVVAKEGECINEYTVEGTDICFEMSGIDGISSDSDNGHRFNVNGIRTSASDKGVQIVNGKKVIRK